MSKITRQKSKKNNVFLIEDETGIYIQKNFKTKKSFDNEINIYKIVEERGVKLPKIIELQQDKEIIYYEYISGKTLAQIAEMEEGEVAINAFEEFGKWLNNFHKTVKIDSLIIGDVNLKNFIKSDKGVIPVDYEEYQMGEKILDIAGIIAFINTHSISISQKHVCIDSFLKGYYESNPLDESLYQEVKKYEEKIQIRRTKV